MHKLTAYVHGRVQGVAFRYYTQKQARSLGLNGWVRNEPDGSVLVVAEGSKEHLSSLIDFLHQGPDSARVEKVEISWSESSRRYKKFEIRAI
ncbi:MAG TPA: acylphosphatase [Patescibacteria group bacterium]|jgi:acylphosphatase|nr:acylphosphatase [Patescibacteria group bacterium]